MERQRRRNPFYFRGVFDTPTDKLMDRVCGKIKSKLSLPRRLVNHWIAGTGFFIHGEMTEFSERRRIRWGSSPETRATPIAERFDELRKPAEGFASLPIEWRVHLRQHRVIALDDKRVFGELMARLITSNRNVHSIFAKKKWRSLGLRRPEAPWVMKVWYLIPFLWPFALTWARTSGGKRREIGMFLSAPFGGRPHARLNPQSLAGPHMFLIRDAMAGAPHMFNGWSYVVIK